MGKTRFIKIGVNGSEYEVEIREENGEYLVKTDFGELRVKAEEAGEAMRAYIEGETHVLRKGVENTLFVDGEPVIIDFIETLPERGNTKITSRERETAKNPDLLVSPLAGRIVEVRIAPGDRISRGDVVVLVESMKMINEIKSPRDGVIDEVRVAQGDSVKKGDIIAVFKKTRSHM